MLGQFGSDGGVTLISATTNIDFEAFTSLSSSSPSGGSVHSTLPLAAAKHVTKDVCYAPLRLLNAVVLSSLLQSSATATSSAAVTSIQGTSSTSTASSSDSSDSQELEGVKTTVAAYKLSPAAADDDDHDDDDDNLLGCKCTGVSSSSRDRTAYALLNTTAAKAVFGSGTSVPLIEAAMKLPPGGGLDVSLVGGLPLVCSPAAAAVGTMRAAAAVQVQGLEYHDLLPVYHVKDSSGKGVDDLTI
jgi:hypothetical protein